MEPLICYLNKTNVKMSRGEKEMKDIQNILNYWYNLEFFSPFWPETRVGTEYINHRNKKIPWGVKSDSKYTYDVYLGSIKSQDLMENMVEAIGVEDELMEKDNSRLCVCGFKLGEDGIYIEDSFSISTFVWAMAKIIREKDLRTDFSTKQIEELNEEINQFLLSIDRILEYEDLEKIYKFVMEKISLSLNKNLFSGIINKKFARKEDIDTSTDMLSSFYVSDIDMIRRKIQNEDKIIQYIEAFKKIMDRIEIDKDVTQMKKWVSPEKYPLGKWPSIYSPSLMQQIAINIGISNEEYIFSVNGPPGTGKTTLLKEIIASNIVERSLLLSEYKKPDDAFIQCQFTSPENEYLKYYYQPDFKLVKYGIIVASNNNAAVENISKELPIAKDVKKSNTKLFNIDLNKEIYFSNIAKNLMDNNEECWGLISARLGKKSNINELKQALWFNKESENLQQLYKGDVPNWEEAKKKFRNKYIEVLNYRKKIKEAVENTDKYEQVVQEYEDAKNGLFTLKSNINAQEDLLKQKIEEQKSVEEQIEMLTKNKRLLHNRLPLYKKIFWFVFKKDPILLELKDVEQKLDKVTMELVDINQKIIHLRIKLDRLKEKLIVTENHFKEIEKTFINSSKQIEKYKKQFGNNFADEKFWRDIQINEISQMASPWTDKHYDTLREELFYDALMLQKAFILNSRAVKQNINCLVNMWNGSFSEKDKTRVCAHLLNTLSLVVPVISTTFASVSTFLKYVDKNELGTLVIDEAGQATPYSALGALWRTSKAIIVGDPLQVEPVVTVPKELSKRFADEFEIETSYRPQELSVQVLADHVNPYGGYREQSSGKLWLGCPLVIHRRCLDPMFSISNKIAYNNRMFKQSVEPKIQDMLVLQESMWIDIKGREKGDRDHFVLEQGEKALKIVLDAFVLQNDFPSIYIISPFKSIAQNMKALLKEAIYNQFQQYNQEQVDSWLAKSCGTVHTFQGKEAKEVLLILGCDENTGVGAAQWAGRTPNILNVAVTRAKYRIGVIGDSSLWKNVPNFDVAYKILCDKQ